MKSRFIVSGLALLIGSLFLLSMTTMQQAKPKPWQVPDKYVKMKNPTKSDAASLKTAKGIWDKHCKSCHGAKGLGDGPKGAGLKTFAGDFSSKDFQKQSDGAIFYKTSFGRDEMPDYTKKIPDDEDRWLLVNFMRGMAKK